MTYSPDAVRILYTTPNGRFALIVKDHSEAEEIVDLKTGNTLFFLATTGFGTDRFTYENAKLVVAHLNSLNPDYLDAVNVQAI